MICVKDPVLADVRGTVMEKDVDVPRLQFFLDQLATFLRLDVLGKGHTGAHLLYGYQIHSNDQTGINIRGQAESEKENTSDGVD